MTKQKRNRKRTTTFPPYIRFGGEIYIYTQPVKPVGILHVTQDCAVYFGAGSSIAITQREAADLEVSSDEAHQEIKGMVKG